MGGCLPIAEHDNVGHGGVRGARHLPELQGQRSGWSEPEGGERRGQGDGAHPVVMAGLLQGGAEEEAAAGDACIAGTLDVPVETGRCRLVRGSGPSLWRPPLRPWYLARLWGSGFVLSITTRFVCFRAVSHLATQRCHEPRVSWGQTASHERVRRGRVTDPEKEVHRLRVGDRDTPEGGLGEQRPEKKKAEAGGSWEETRVGEAAGLQSQRGHCAQPRHPPCSRGRIQLTRDAPAGRWTSQL